MVIGTVVKSNSHISYMCRVYGKLESADQPPPGEYAFGTFVVLQPVEGGDVSLVGIIRDTFLVNPEYGSIGPRLSSNEDLEVFSPDYLNEKGVLVEILILGWIDRIGGHHGIPALSAQVGTAVRSMSDNDVHDFHRDSQQRFFMGYLPALMMRNDPTIASLLLIVLERLAPQFPLQHRVIGVLKNNLAWKARVVPAG